MERIEIRPLSARGKAAITLHGRIAELLNLPYRKSGDVLRTVVMVVGPVLSEPVSAKIP